MRRTAQVLLGVLFTCGVWAASAETVIESSGVRGGLVVRIGCADPAGMVALRAGERYLVHGLDADAGTVAKARTHIQGKGVYGPVSVDTFDGKGLPYAENMVNLLVADKLGEVSMDEVMRVLVPRGVAIIGGEKTVKPVPPEIDEWTHFLHGADGNGVARDTVVGPPRRFKWKSEPAWARNHEIRKFFRAMVSGGGRVFYCVDEGQPGLIRQLPDRWTLVARDAFNGLTLWKKSVSGMPKNEQIVVDGNRLYFSAQDGVVVLDAATGEELRKLEDALKPYKLALTGRTLLCSRGKGIIAIDADSAKTLWESDGSGAQAMVAGGGVVAFVGPEGTTCLDLENGNKLWSAAGKTKSKADEQDGKGKKTRKRKSNAKPALIVQGGLVLESSGKEIKAYAAKTGKIAWVVKAGGGGSMRSQDIFVARGCVWKAVGKGINGYDLETGELKKTIDPSGVQSHGHHLRCYQSKATERFLVTQYRGAEFISLTDDKHFNHDWVRGACHYGVMPANGLLYTPPDECFCYGGAKMVGLNVLGPASDAALDAVGRGPGANLLEKGPAYGKCTDGASAAVGDDWPSYRHDARRTGATRSEVPARVQERWRVKLDGRLTQAVSSGGIVYVAVKDRHMLHALAADSGKELWRFTAGGTIDSSPTLYEGKVLLGCSDGWVYCLRASDGELAWRFRAAPEQRLVMDRDRLESAWRVHGSVIVEKGVLYCTAGRSSFLDGGVFLYGLNPDTGEIIHRARLDTRMATREDAVDHKFSTAFHIEGARADILVAEGGHIFLNQIKFTPDLKQVDTPYVIHAPDNKTAGLDVSNVDYVAKNPYLEKGFDKAAALGVSRGHLGDRDVGLHMFTTGGFLEDSWFNRTYWMYAKTWPGFQIGHIAPKTGQLLVVGDRWTYAVQAYPTRNNHSPMFRIGSKGYLLTADKNDNEPMLDYRSWSRDKGMGFTRGAPPQWHQWVPIRMRAMVLAGEHLFVAGAPDVLDPEDPMAPFEGRKGMILRALDASSGKQLGEYKMESAPVFDGMSAAGGKLLISLRNGELLCLGAR